jgi:RNA polymerase sigma factor (sigma-70 family)
MLLESVCLKAQSYASAESFLRDYDPSWPGCLVLDVRMPVISGLALQEMLIAQGVDIPIIFITGHGDVPTSVRAMKAHALDFIEKPFNDQDLLDKIYEAIERDAQTRQQRANTAEIAAYIASLTSREQEIMRMIVDGKPNKVIAIELNISEKTVQSHRTSIMKKMRAVSLAALIKMALKAGWDQGEPPSE